LQLIFPPLLKRLRAESINPALHFIASGVPSANLSSAARWQFLITPAPPANKEIVKEALFESRMMCFYDGLVRKPPTTWKQFVDSQYVEVRFSDTESSMMVLPNIDISALKAPTITTPNFSSLASLIKGSDLITTQLGLMKMGLLHELDSAPLPLKTNPLTLFLAWHQRDHDDPAHSWLRRQIKTTVDSILQNE
jgi:DNA-binding transcriptional LysR family regulator